MTDHENRQPRLARTLRRPGLAIATGLIAVTGGLALPQAANTAAPSSTSVSASTAAAAVPLSRQVRIRSAVVGSTASGRRVTGTYTPRQFFMRNDVLRVRGVLHAAVHRADGTVRHITKRGVGFRVARIATPSSMTSRAATPSAREANAALVSPCSILRLVLGPLDLDLLGLQVHLDRVVLTIIAVSGAGNLLGNLLCAIAGLLDAGQLAGLLGQVANLLNDILAILNA